jgi:hypothetical protein
MDKTSQILDSEEKQIYRISVKGVAVFAITSALCLLVLWFTVFHKYLQDPTMSYLIPWGSIGLILVMIPSMWLTTTLEIDNEGIRLYRINVMKWDEAVNAKRVNLWGLKYLKVTRHKGMDWWIPLYLKGHQPIEDALKEKCPAGNPILQLFASDS